MNNETEKMTYGEAAIYLGIRVDSLRHAIKRGVLTPFPRQGLYRYIPAEQVRLFKGKPLALSSLTQYEGSVWERIAEQASGKPTHHTVLPYLSPEIGLSQGERFGQNYVRGVYKGILEHNPSIEEALKSPLAV